MIFDAKANGGFTYALEAETEKRKKTFSFLTVKILVYWRMSFGLN